MESKHMLILGTTGSGKGVLLNQLVAQINERKRKKKTNDRCIFYDVKGEFVAKQFQKGDLIFYPFDARSLSWNIFCANQDLGRIQEQYGEANLKSFYNNFNTTITFRIKEPETSEFLSKAVGEQQLVKLSESSQLDPKGVGDKKSISEQEKLERLVLPSEFQTLKDLNGIISIAGKTSKIIIPRIFYEEKRPNF